MSQIRAIALAAAASVLVAASTVALYRTVTRRRHAVRVPRSLFITIMREISISAFNVLFEYAQMAARAAGGTSESSMRAFLENDSNLRFELEARQAEVLRRHELLESDLVFAQNLYSDSEANAVVAAVPAMFIQYVDGLFPTLPVEVLAAPSHPVTDDELLTRLRAMLEAKLTAVAAASNPVHAFAGEAIDELADPEEIVVFQNSMANRINQDIEFRRRLMMLVMGSMNDARNQLDTTL